MKKIVFSLTLTRRKNIVKLNAFYKKITIFGNTVNFGVVCHFLGVLQLCRTHNELQYFFNHKLYIYMPPRYILVYYTNSINNIYL